MSADDVYWWANWILVAALLVGVAATYAIVVSGGIKERTLRRQVADAGAVAQTARANAAAATERASKLEKETAQAQERTATLEREAAEARLEQERLKAQLAWRTISPEATVALTADLAKNPASINIQYQAGDTEAMSLAIQLSNIFGNAHWQVGMSSATRAGTVIFGLFVPDDPSPATASVRAALTAAHISFSTESLPPTGMGFGNTLPNAPTLIVGSKPIQIPH